MSSLEIGLSGRGFSLLEGLREVRKLINSKVYSGRVVTLIVCLGLCCVLLNVFHTVLLNTGNSHEL